MNTNQVEPPQNADLSNPLLTTATCNSCGLQIKPGEYRVVVVAAELGTIPHKIDSSRIGGRRRFLAFCARCSFGVVGGSDDEGRFVLRHPLVRVLFGSTRKQISQDIAFEKCFDEHLMGIAEEGRLEGAGRQVREKELTAAVRCGDENAIDAPRARATVSKKDDRALVAEYLLSPEARALKLSMRRTGELYSMGKNQKEIETELGRHQSAVSRVLRDLKAKAYVWDGQKEVLETLRLEEIARMAVAAGDEKQIEKLLPSHPRAADDDVMAHATTGGKTDERWAIDPRHLPARKVGPAGAGPDK